MITISSSGSFKNTRQFLKAMQKLPIMDILNRAGKKGVDALSVKTPTDTGRAASSWYYEARKRGGNYEIVWSNSDIEDGFPVALMLQYGHGTGTGGYVQGIDYLNPALRPIFDQIAYDVWKAVTSA